MVSPYPPARDGIGSYAVQEVRVLRAAGHEVDVLSPEPSAAHLHLDFSDWRAPIALARRLRSYDRVIAQYHPQLFYTSGDPNSRALANAGLIAAFRWGRNVELRVHEWDGERYRPSQWRDRLTRALWLSAQRIAVHTARDREAFCDHFAIPRHKVDVVSHRANFTRLTTANRATARRRLGIPQEQFAFLSIGFLQQHKGFDRAVRAFAGLHDHGCRLDIVGSARVDDPAILEHVGELRRLTEDVPGVSLHERYVTDEIFDLWIVAADAIVLPYREIWSSSVLERAALYDRRVVLTRAGGLEDQAPADAVFVDDDQALADAMRDLAGRPRTTTPPPAWDPAALTDRERLMAEIRSRAAALRGSSDAPVVDGDASAALRRIPPLSLPLPHSQRPGVGLVKRLVRRVTAWEVDPIVGQVNQLRRGIIESLEADRVSESTTSTDL